jgi:hypothetical protein
MERIPVLYLDIDDTLISWEGGEPHAAVGARDFFLWILDHFEIRWLTTWCPNGTMGEKLLRDLASMIKVPVHTLREIHGCGWDMTETKLNGIAWLEHLVQGRPFVWLEDDFGFTERERTFLDAHGFLDRYLHCNVTSDRNALSRALVQLRSRLSELTIAAA